MAKRTVKDLDVKGKKVIVRCDFNVPRKDGVITNDNRIVQALPTIKYLLEQGAKVILMSHLGKVKTEEDKAKNSLECVAVRLAELLPDTKVEFCNETRGPVLEEMVNDLKDGQILLIQNTRYETILNWASTGQAWVMYLWKMHSVPYTVHMHPLSAFLPTSRKTVSDSWWKRKWTCWAKPWMTRNTPSWPSLAVPRYPTRSA